MLFRRALKFLAPSKKPTRAFRPRVEVLESRLNLAGNVRALVAGPILHLTGDSLANDLRIVGTAANAFTVTGVGTSVNGVANGTLNLTGIQNIFIDLQNGDDRTTFVNANLSGMLRFTGGNGNDTLAFGDANGQTNAFGSIQAVMGAGNDEISVTGDSFTARSSFITSNGDGNNTTDLDPAVSLILGVVSITGGSGSDFVDLGDGTVNTGPITVSSGAGDNDFFLDGNVTVNGGISVLGGSGPDNFEPGDGGGNQITVNGSIVASLGDGTNFVEFAQDNTDVTGAISVVTGSGQDTFDIDSDTFDILALSLALGEGDDEVLLNEGSTNIRGSLTITTAGGADELTAIGLNVVGATSINTGDGLDLIALDNSRFRSAVSLLTGSGNDTVNVERNSNNGIGTRFDSAVSVDLGAGNDTIAIGLDVNDFVTFASTVVVNGGLGTDTLTQAGPNVFAFAPILILFP